jgi:hypothetical protein
MPTFDEVKLTQDYISSLERIFATPESINTAVKERQILIKDPAQGQDARNTLETISDQFDPVTGNRKADATFVYHNPKRTQDELKLYTNDNWNDWTKVAVTSAYFSASSSLAMANPTNADVGKFLVAMQFVVAEALRNNFKFDGPMSYQTDSATQEQFGKLRENAPEIAQRALAMYQLITELSPKALALKAHVEEIAKRGAPSESSAQKQEILGKMYQAINYYIDPFDSPKNPKPADFQAYDLGRLLIDLKDVQQREQARPRQGWISHPTSDSINEITQIIEKHALVISPGTLLVANLHATLKDINSHIKEIEDRKPASESETKNYDAKIAILKDLVTTIEEFNKTYTKPSDGAHRAYDASYIISLNAKLDDILRRDAERPQRGWFSHPTSDLIKGIQQIVASPTAQAAVSASPTQKLTTGRNHFFSEPAKTENGIHTEEKQAPASPRPGGRDI